MTYFKKKYLLWFFWGVLFFVSLFYLNQLKTKVQIQVQQKVIKEIQKYSLQTGYKWKWSALSVSFLPFQITIKNPTWHLPHALVKKPLFAKKLIIKPDYSQLLKKSLKAKVILIQPDIQVALSDVNTFSHPSVKSQFTNNKFLNKKIIQQRLLKFLFQKNLPLSKVILKAIKLNILSQKNILSTHNMTVSIKLHALQATLKIQAPKLQLKDRPIFAFVFDTKLTSQKITIKKFTLYNAYSSIDLSGWMDGSLKKILTQWQQNPITKATLHLKTVMRGQDFTTLNQFTQSILPTFIVNKIKNLSYKGTLALTTDGHYKKSQGWRGDFQMSTKDFSTKKIFFSQIQAQGTLHNQEIYFNNLTIQHSLAWKLHFHSAKINLKSPYLFQTNLFIKKSQLYSLFQAMNLKTTRISAFINGQWQCTGSIYLFSITCKEGQATARRFIIHSNNKWNILKVPHFQIKNEWSVSKGVFQTNGIAFTDSSQINFTTWLNKNKKFLVQVNGKVDFTKDVENIVHTGLKGKVHFIGGRIERPGKTTSHVSIKTHLKGKQITLLGVEAGNIHTTLNYSKGFLRFMNLKAQFKQSYYRGHVKINIPKRTIYAFADFEAITLDNMCEALHNKVTLPVQTTGRGRLTAYIHGPLKKRKLSYNIQSQFKNIKLKNELFDKAFINLESQKGKITFKKLVLTKKTGDINVTGGINTYGNINAHIIGSKLNIEDSQNITKHFGANFLGLVDFNMHLKGFLKKPIANVQTTIKNTYFKSQALQDSQLSLQISSDKVKIKGSLFNTVHIKNLTIPYKENKTVHVKLQTDKLNIYDFLLPYSIASHSYHNMVSDIHSDWNLTYKKNHFKKTATGSIRIQKLNITDGIHNLSNHKKIDINLKKGEIKTSPIQLADSQHSLHIKPYQQHTLVKGTLKAKYLIFLFPFMKSLNGNLNMNLRLKNQLFQLNQRGWIKIKDGNFQLHSSLKPFENTQAKIEIKNHLWNIPFFYANTGGGKMQAKGWLHFKKSLVPLNIKGIFKKVQFNGVPNIHTTGSGRFQLTGNNFPYTLNMIASLEDTKIETEFQSQTRFVPTSLFLPKFLKKKKVEPIKLALNLHLKKPASIKNSTMKATLLGNIRINGLPTHPLVSGQLNILPGGDIIFRDHKFQIVSADIKYLNNKPTQPLIDLVAQTTAQEQSTQGNFFNKYNIFLKVKGQGAKATFTLNSNPILTENEIISLLAFGSKSIAFKTHDSNPNTATNKIAKYSSYQMGSAVLQKVLDKELNHLLGLDQFSIVPHINHRQNTVATKLILKKKVLNKINFSTSRTILDKTPENNVSAAYQINNHTSLIGFWKNTAPIGGSNQENDVIGFDLEYQVDF